MIKLPRQCGETEKKMTEDWVYMFVAGLDHNLDQVSSCVLATSPLPSLEEAHSVVCWDVQTLVIMRTKDHIEASALAI